MRSIKKVFRGGVSELSEIFSSKTIESWSSETNTFAIVDPSEFFIIGTVAFFFSVLRVRSEAFVKLVCLSIVFRTEIFFSSFSISSKCFSIFLASCSFCSKMS
jgi:hypothetical protein